MMDKSKLMEALQRLPISFGMSMGVRSKCQKVAGRYDRVNRLSYFVVFVVSLLFCGGGCLCCKRRTFFCHFRPYTR